MGEGSTVPAQVDLKSRGLLIGDLARLTGLRPSAIRYYEACHLLPAPSRRSGRRRYDREAIARVKAIIAARKLGFTIRELRELSLMDLRARKAAALRRADSIKARIAELGATATRLEQLSKCDCTAGSPCGL